MNYRERLLTLSGIAALAFLGFFSFPGHTWLQSDTQIYAAILEHLRDPSVLQRDLVATRPHVTWTIYDEVALWGRSLTGAGFKTILQVEQLLFRFIGLLGFFALARALRLGRVGALVATSIFALGAVVNGPSVLTLEYEPVPRGFALMIVLAGLGAASRGAWQWAGALGGLAVLFHPPTAAPFCGLCFLACCSREGWQRRRAVLPGLIGGAALLVAFAKLQHGETEAQPFFSLIDPALEKLQRMRAPYNWISQWPREWLWQYPLLFVFDVLAWLRLQRVLHLDAHGFEIREIRWITWAFPLYGLLMMPASWLLMEQAKWTLMAQFQPARAVLFLTMFAILLGGAASWHAARRGQWGESIVWAAVVFILPVNGNLMELAGLTGLKPPAMATRWIAVLAFAGATAAASLLWETRKKIALAVAVILIPSLLLPYWPKIQNYPKLHTAELRAMIEWARTNTKKDAVFQFADNGHGLDAGIFRAEALRALYVDWKGGGQVNLLSQFAVDWYSRWQQVREAQAPVQPLAVYDAMGIDYLVVRVEHALPDATPLFERLPYVVYGTHSTRVAAASK